MKSMPHLTTPSPFNGTQLCLEYDADIFYPDEYDDASVAEAKSICNDCWMKNDCLEFALSTREKEGIWGGTTPDERYRIRRRVRK